MQIRKTTYNDVDKAAEIYDNARAFMRSTGNMTQWADGYPNRETVILDIASDASYVCEENGEILAIFYFSIGEDKTYNRIYDGEWICDGDYAVIHRIAVSDKARGRGVAAFVFNECFVWYPNLKIDTHKDNIPMQKALLRSGFEYCGIIYLESGEERLAYQKVKR